MIKKQIKYKDGTVFIGDQFEESDYKNLRQIFKDWFELNSKLSDLGGRGINVPDVFSEGLFCYYFNAVRTNGTAYSFDAIMISSNQGVQIKSASIDKDLTSFGPKSTWDELYYVDFAPNSIVDGNIAFYKIDLDLRNLVLNKKKNETFLDQQKQGRRPRLSIKNEVIRKYKLKPIKLINILIEE
jgi:hypothetical protein